MVEMVRSKLGRLGGEGAGFMPNPIFSVVLRLYSDINTTFTEMEAQIVTAAMDHQRGVPAAPANAPANANLSPAQRHNQTHAMNATSRLRTFFR